MNNQMVKICLMNLRGIPTRSRASVVAIIGSACVVGVLVTVLSMATGFELALQATSKNDEVVMLKGEATTELVSNIDTQSYQKLRLLPGIARSAGKPMVSGQLLVVMSLPLKGSGALANVSLRGVDEQAFKLHNISILQGRFAVSGKREVIVGSRAVKQFEGLQVGSTIGTGNNVWNVVGIFKGNGGSHESEIWADIAMVQTMFNRENMLTSVWARVDSGEAKALLTKAIDDDPQLNITVKSADDYFATQSQALGTFIKSIGYTTAIIMAIGAVFASLNTMYSSISSRRKEIGILRALGFGHLAISISVFVEAILLTLIGGLIGCLFVYLIFNGYSVSTINMTSFTQVAFSFRVTPETIQEGLSMALVIGIIGGLSPALHASKFPIAEGIRKAS